MKKAYRFTAAGLSAVMLAVCLSPAALAKDSDPVTKEETVYVTLAPDGSIKTQTVSDWLHSDAGLAGIRDKSLLQDIKNLKSSEQPSVNGSDVSWDSMGSNTDVYYQGTTDKTPPVTAAIHYFMDGTEMSAEEIEGKSGHLTITVELTNNETEVKSIRGVPRTICTPFVTVVGAVLSEDFENVVAENGTVQSDGNNQVVGFVCVPGVKQSMNGLLTGKLEDLEDKFLDTVTLEADVTNLELPSLMIACATDASLLDLNDTWTDLDDTFDDLDELRDATDELMDGVHELYDGSLDLYDAVFNDLTDGVNKLHDEGTQKLVEKIDEELKPGTEKLANGTREYYDALRRHPSDQKADQESFSYKMDQASDGMLQAQSGLNEFAYMIRLLDGMDASGNNDHSNSVALVQGAKTVVNALFAGATSQLNEALEPMGCSVSETLTLDNYNAVLDKLTQEVFGVAQTAVTAAVEQQVTAQVTEAVNAQEDAIRAGVEKAARQNVEAGARQSVETAVRQGVEDGVRQGVEDAVRAEVTSQVQQEAAQMDPAPTEEELNTLIEQKMASDDVQALIEQKMASDEVQAMIEQKMASEEVQALIEQKMASDEVQTMIDQKMQSEEVKALIDENIATQKQTLIEQNVDQKMQSEEVQQIIMDQLESQKESNPQIQQLLETIKQLKQAGYFYTSLQTYTDGVTALAVNSSKLVDLGARLVTVGNQLVEGAKLLTEKSKDIADGAAKLDDGVVKLQDGAKELDDGVSELQDGVGDLRDGVNDLVDGTKELDDGVIEYNDEGISKLTDSEDIDHVKSIRYIAEEMQSRTENYASYTGAPDGVNAKVRFVMKTDAPEKPESTEAETVTETVKLTLWQRIKRLFGLK